ncbi:MAG TPA: type II secretion system protein [Candidatus Pacearchaeota archaeon]|nr:type II secretion system protein [Candidatus Pacearchaeota archaeon]
MNKGFTLIELLTVVAIVAILAAGILITFPAAQERARDARLINAMQQLRAAAEASRGSYGDYSQIKTVGSSDPMIGPIMEEINRVKGSYPTVHLEMDGDVAIGFCAEIALISGTRLWCVDSDMYSDYVSSTQCTAAGDRCD